MVILEKAFTRYYERIAAHVRTNNPGLHVKATESGVYVANVGAVIAGSYISIKNDATTHNFWVEWLEQPEQDVQIISSVTGLGWSKLTLWAPHTSPESYMQDKPATSWGMEAIKIASIPAESSPVNILGRTFYMFRSGYADCMAFVNNEGCLVNTWSYKKSALEECLQSGFLPESIVDAGMVRERCLNHWQYLLTNAEGESRLVTVWRN